MLRLGVTATLRSIGLQSLPPPGSATQITLRPTAVLLDSFNYGAMTNSLTRPFASLPEPVEDEGPDLKEEKRSQSQSSRIPVSSLGGAPLVDKVPPLNVHPSSSLHMHALGTASAPTHRPGQVAEYLMSAPAYSKEYLHSVVPQHRKPVAFHDWTGYYGVRVLRSTFDLITGYGRNMTEKKWLTRFLFLETVAGVPGMVAAGLRHMRSLRTMRRDKGWIHTLLEEAENERMHLLTFMEMAEPGLFFRGAVLGAQGIFTTLYTAAYALSPRHCHAFVSYLEEEAVKTYTRAIEDIDSGKLPEWQQMKAPDIAVSYWRLAPDSTIRDLLLAVRADEASHKHVNAAFAEMKADDPNPFSPGSGTMVA